LRTTVTEIKPRTAAPANTATIALSAVRPGGHDDLALFTDPNVLDDRPPQPEQPRHTLIPRTSQRLPEESSPEEAGNPRVIARSGSLFQAVSNSRCWL
jgi:hypothetical protein